MSRNQKHLDFPSSEMGGRKTRREDSAAAALESDPAHFAGPAELRRTNFKLPQDLGGRRLAWPARWGRVWLQGRSKQP